MTYQEAEKILRTHGVKPSLLRYKILDYLHQNKTHPTIETIFKDLKPEIPTLSKTSLYNNLYLFAEKEIVKILSIDEKEIRFDYDTTPHAHFKCVVCGRIYDIPINMEISHLYELEGFDIKEADLYLKGVCKHCKN